jgi:hypothetical protein
MTLRNFIESELTEQTNNHMCRMVAGIAADTGNVILDKWLLDLAMYNFNRHYVVYGVIEQYEKMISKIAVTLNWDGYKIYCENIGKKENYILNKETLDVI